jgi:acetyl esterase/lipase
VSVLRGRVHTGAVTSALAAAALALMCGACVGTSVGPMTLDQYLALRGPAPTAHIAYGTEPSQYVEFFQPEGSGPFPVAVVIHGGCFTKRFGGIEQLRGLAGALSSQGIAVWSIEYRRLDEAGGGYPGTFVDVSTAVDALAAEAAGRRLDLTRVVAVGHSVGGYLAQWIAARDHIPVSSPLYGPHSVKVSSVVSLGGIGDLRPQTVQGRTACGYPLAAITGTPEATRPDVFADTTPAELLPNGSRTVLINGQFDDYSPPTEAAEYARRVRRSGDQIDNIVLPHASHYDEVAVSSPSWKLVLPQIQQALQIRQAR